MLNSYSTYRYQIRRHSIYSYYGKNYLKKTDLAKKLQTAKLTSEKRVSSVFYDKFGLSDNDSSEV